MTTASLHNRVRRLESSTHFGRLDRAELLRSARVRRLAMDPVELAAHDAERRARCIAAISEPDELDGPLGSEQHSAHLTQALKRRAGRRFLAEYGKGLQ